MTVHIADLTDTCCGVGGRQMMAAADAQSLADLLKAIADPTRVRLIAYLADAPGDTVCACHLPGELGISQPTLSHHLKKLVDAGILTREQRGRWAHYTVVPAALDGIRAFLAATTT
jgi:ArsR family transcriptional regulator